MSSHELDRLSSTLRVAFNQRIWELKLSIEQGQMGVVGGQCSTVDSQWSPESRPPRQAPVSPAFRGTTVGSFPLALLGPHHQISSTLHLRILILILSLANMSLQLAVAESDLREHGINKCVDSLT